MKSMNLTQVKSFLTFDLPLDSRYIGTQFTNTHHHLATAHPGWCLQATQQKLTARYWLRHVLTHFASLYSFAVAVTLPFNTQLNQFYLAAVLMAGVISFSILAFTNYWPHVVF